MKKLVHQKKKYLEIQERRLKEMLESKNKSKPDAIEEEKKIDIGNDPNIMPTCEEEVKSWEEDPEVEWWDLAILKKYESTESRDPNYQPYLPLLSNYYINEVI